LYGKVFPYVFKVKCVVLFERCKGYLGLDQRSWFRCYYQRSTHRQCSHHGKCVCRLCHSFPCISLSQVYKPGVQFVRGIQCPHHRFRFSHWTPNGSLPIVSH
jgi:hypothetical protein